MRKCIKMTFIGPLSAPGQRRQAQLLQYFELHNIKVVDKFLQNVHT